MTTAQHRVRLDALNTQARQVKFGRVLLTAVAAVLWAIGWGAHKVIGGGLYGVGWAAAKTVTVAWMVLVWVGLAIKVGWMDARGGAARGPA